MIRPPRRRVVRAVTGAVLSGVLGLGGPLAAAGTSPASAAPADSGEDPLSVTLDRIGPATVPERGRVTVRGRVTNSSDEDWTELAVYLVTSQRPITTREDLADAVESDPLAECPQVCSRLVDPGLFVDVPDLSPGESASFRLAVPRDDLGISGEPGVYWLGVQVLGSNAEGRLPGADGRARTFLPLVPPRTPPTGLAVGLQVRNPIVRGGDGRLEFLPGWQRALSSRGRLGRLLDLSGTAGDFPLSLLLDPAVLDAAESVAAGNPPLELGSSEEDPEADPESEEAPEASDSADESSSPAPGAEEGDADRSPAADRRVLAAGVWVEELLEVARAREVHRLPYGDLDVAAAADVEEGLLPDALALGDAALRARDVTSSPLLAPLRGTLPAEVVRELDPGIPIVLDSAYVPEGSPVRTRGTGGHVVVADPSLTAGGPAPGDTRGALQVRQRLLAEAALHALSEDRRQPLVALLPPTWDPGGRWRQADLFGGLDVPWIRPAGLSEVLRTSAGDRLVADDVVYPEAQVEAQLPSYTVLATGELRELGTTMGELLADEGDFAGRLDRQALLTSSTFARVRPGRALSRNRAAQARVRDWLGRVDVRGPAFVTMSSESGTFQVTVVNRLDQPVTLGLRATASGEALSLETLPESVVLEAKGRTSMQVDATASDIGVHRVDLQPVTASGDPVGRPLELSIRTSQVGLVVWIVMVAGGTLLLAAVAVRVARRITGRRRTRGALDHLEEDR